MNIFFLLVGSYLIGTHLLAVFGISVPVVQIGRGLIVISTGWAMLKQSDEDQKEPRNVNRNMHFLCRKLKTIRGE